MVMLTDCSVGFKEETTYGTGVTVDRWPEFVEESFVQENEYIDSEGLRVGGIGVDLSRRTLGKVVAHGGLNLEAVTRGLGTFWKAALGSATSTLRSGAIYQQVAQPGVGDRPPSFTVQKGVVTSNGGTVSAHTFLGACVDSWKVSAQAGEALMIESDWVAKEMVTATAYAAPSYVASPKTFAYPHLYLSFGVNGVNTLTAPTATALASGGTGVLTATKAEFTGKNNLDDGGYNSGYAGKRGRSPSYGVREFGGALTLEYDWAKGEIYRDYYLNQTDLFLVATFTSDQDDIGASGTFAALQFVFPSIRLEGAVPTTPKAGEVPEVDIEFTAGRKAGLATCYVVSVTADTAL